MIPLPQFDIDSHFTWIISQEDQHRGKGICSFPSQYFISARVTSKNSKRVSSEVKQSQYWVSLLCLKWESWTPKGRVGQRKICFCLHPSDGTNVPRVLWHTSYSHKSFYFKGTASVRAKERSTQQWSNKSTNIYSCCRAQSPGPRFRDRKNQLTVHL